MKAIGFSNVRFYPKASFTKIFRKDTRLLQLLHRFFLGRTIEILR